MTAPQGRTVHRFYDVSVRTSPTGAVLSGDLVEVRPLPPLDLTFPPRPHRFPADHTGLFDATGDLLGPLLPLPVERDETVPLTVLTKSVEDRALLIPPAALDPDTDTFTFRLDRAGCRAAVADDESRYRASAELRVEL